MPKAMLFRVSLRLRHLRRVIGGFYWKFDLLGILWRRKTGRA
ncbi:MAG: hypothetical protein Q9M48_14920 [Rhodobacterales bacterium]|nr:hypothetical protein [Rhodobacterales bacterium]